MGRARQAAVIAAILGAGVVPIGGCTSVPLGPDPSLEPEDCTNVGQQRQPLRTTCFQKELEPEADTTLATWGQVPCRVLTFEPQGDPYCACSEVEGLSPVDPALLSVVLEDLQRDQTCRDACCEGLCFCELQQLAGADLAYCLGLDAEPRAFGEDPIGWCYLDPDDGFGDPALVEHCPTDDRRELRTLPERAWGNLAIMCQGYVAH
jgi:hypothetical protein